MSLALLVLVSWENVNLKIYCMNTSLIGLESICLIKNFWRLGLSNSHK